MNTDNSRLTSPEITNLLTQYEQETMSICIGKYVLANAKDTQIRFLYKLSLELSKQHVEKLKEFFREAHFPEPKGLTEKDVNIDAPTLFTDIFWLEYLHGITHFALSGYGLASGVSVRKDIRKYFYQCISETMEIYDQSVDLLVSKGLYELAPYYSNPEKSETITSLGYSLDIVGKKRPMNTAEAGNIFVNLTMTRLAKGLSLGFYQVTKNKEVRHFLEKVLNTINKNYGIFSSLLLEENLRAPELLDREITNSTIAPFSNKLMMHQIGFFLVASATYYGTAMVASLRYDIVGHCEAAVLRGAKLLPNWLSIIAENGWIEKLPEANDRQELPRN